MNKQHIISKISSQAMSPINIYYAFEKSKIWKHQCKRLIP